MPRDGVVGVSDHGGWAVFVTADGEGRLLDRRRVELVDEGLPKIPHHSEGQRLPIGQAVQLVERVRASAERKAELALGAVTAALDGRVVAIALRECQALPPTVAERITNYRASNVADWVMYRRALGAAAEARGWPVYWYDSRKVQAIASEALGLENLDDHFARLRRSIGPPWGQDHRLAMAAAIAARAILVGDVTRQSGRTRG